MGRILALFTLLMSLMFAAGPAAWALRCGSEVVTRGDHKLEVLRNCGEPDLIDRWQERQLNHYYYFGHWYPNAETVIIEVWSYNFGPSRFMRSLRFENGELQEIETHGYGFSNP